MSVTIVSNQVKQFRSIPVNTFFYFEGHAYLKETRCKKQSNGVYVGVAKEVMPPAQANAKMLQPDGSISIMLKKRGRKPIHRRSFIATIPIITKVENIL